MRPDSAGDGQIPQGPEFPSTHWSVVLAASDAPTPAARDALERLCQTYWQPLYAFVRRHGHGPDDAMDLTQEFFSRFLEHNSFRRAERERGRFRTFLLTCLKNFLVNEWRKDQAAKRRSGPTISLNQEEAEYLYQADLGDTASPDKIYEKRWAAALLNQVLNRLGEEYAAQGKRELFNHVKLALWGAKTEVSYTELAGQLAMTEAAVRVAVHRLRQRYLQLLRSEVAATLDNPADIDDELRYLIQVMSG
jgi:RNA polymerase sigma factor (sigma-70 family)